MMMQILEAGGIPIVTDKLRKADEDNPKGYYEFEKVKQLSKDASWLPETVDKAIKIVHLLLYELPPDLNYRVIFMQRKLPEVLASQHKMLQRQNRKGANVGNEQLAKNI